MCCKSLFCFHLIVKKKKKKGTGSHTHPEGWDYEFISCQALRRLSQLTDLSSCFLRLGFVQSCVGRPHTFRMNNTSVPLYEKLENF